MDYYNIINKGYQDVVKNHVLYPKFKIELLDQYERAYAELVQDISSQSEGSITCQMQQGVRKTISLSFFDPTGMFMPNPNEEYIWIGRKFKVYIGLQKKEYEQTGSPLMYDNVGKMTSTNPDAADVKIIKTSDFVEENLDIYWFSKGVYIITAVNDNTQNGRLINIQGVDKYGAFGNETGYGEMVGTFAIEAGTSVEWAFKEMLRQDIGNGVMLDPIEPIIDPFYQNFKLPLEISKGPGSYLSELLNDLANSLHADIYYDNEGRLNVKRALNYDEYRNLQKSWDFHLGDQEYLPPTVTYEFLQVANYVYVVGDNPSIATLPVAKAENRNARSPLSIQKIGRKTRYIESSVIKTKKEAQDYANYILKMYSILGNTVSFSCTFIPHLDLDQIVSITDDRFNYNSESFIISAITIPIGLGTMTIQGSNIVELPEA